MKKYTVVGYYADNDQTYVGHVEAESCDEGGEWTPDRNADMGDCSSD